MHFLVSFLPLHPNFLPHSSVATSYTSFATFPAHSAYYVVQLEHFFDIGIFSSAAFIRSIIVRLCARTTPSICSTMSMSHSSAIAIRQYVCHYGTFKGFNFQLILTLVHFKLSIKTLLKTRPCHRVVL